MTDPTKANGMARGMIGE
jgi:hypothetical protein